MNAKPRRFWREALAVFAIALAVNTVNIDHTGFYDEFYHVLAAQSWLENGTLHVGDGIYTRSSYFTILISWVFAIFGESLVAARMVSAVAGASLAAAVFWWTASVTSRCAARIAVLLVCLSPINLFLAQIVRFYAIHSLLFWIGAIAVYALVAGPAQTKRQVALAFAAAVSLTTALSLQITTLIGAAGLAVWVAVELLERVPWRGILSSKGRIVAVVIGGFTIAAASFVVISSDLLVHPWTVFRFSPLWAASSQSSIDYYHWWFLNNYPTFWALLPVAFLAACASARRPAIFCAVVFTVVIFLHSLGGTKGGRYIAYVLPMFFVLWGIALANGIRWLSILTRKAAVEVFGESGTRLTSNLLQPLVFLIVLAFLLASNPAFRLTYKMVARDDQHWPESGPGYRGDPDWSEATPLLRELADDSSVVITSAGIKALYYLGEIEFDLSVTNIAETGSEFMTDDRTGGLLVGTVESMKLIRECYRSGLVVIEKRHWRNSWAVSDAVADFLEDFAKPVDFPPSTRLLVFRWKGADNFVSTGCERIRVMNQDSQPFDEASE